MNAHSKHRKTALVTGASSGIGKAIAIQLAHKGWNILLHHFGDERTAGEVLEEILQGGGEGHMLTADLGDPSQVKGLAAEARKLSGGVDLLVNNAGVSYKKHFLDHTLEDIDHFTKVNFRGTVLLTQAIALQMVEQERPGAIYTLTSVNAIRPGIGHSVYGATKGALETLMKGVAVELAPHGIRVNTLVIGAIKTAINEAVWHDAEKRQAVEQHIPLGRMGEVEDIAAIVAQLVDHDRYMTGSSITIDGGWLAKAGFASAKPYGDEE
ncbi:SDR family oxidoreductase [Olivibacter sp. SDN3]|uniref:SDR family NAD(P)-dependent oxidoreductase n=1 Tax=Olivibacter sp. SDN3 TaxID=2764720 RepID=UPI00165174A3|nr:SDR family oxidoreductase [Olivibacter sp. SDN3]QNL47953.1 SDR family oxidoreductase [Olivibacter sp. SDN3]